MIYSCLKKFSFTDLYQGSKTSNEKTVLEELGLIFFNYFNLIFQKHIYNTLIFL